MLQPDSPSPPVEPLFRSLGSNRPRTDLTSKPILGVGRYDNTSGTDASMAGYAARPYTYRQSTHRFGLLRRSNHGLLQSASNQHRLTLWRTLYRLADAYCRFGIFHRAEPRRQASPRPSKRKSQVLNTELVLNALAPVWASDSSSTESRNLSITLNLHPTQTPSLSNHALAMRVTFFHWGLHPWALYALVGLALSFFAYRHQLPMTLRSTLYPLLKDKVHGWLGDTIDTLAVVSTLIGVATSLGLGVLQLNAGLTFLFDAPDARWFQSLLIGLITLAATLSVVSGLSNGVRRLSEANILIAGLSLVGRALLWTNPGDYHGLPQELGLLSQWVTSPFNVDRRHRDRAGMARRLDHFLLGLVDCMGTLCWNVHRQDLLWTNHPRIPPRSTCHPHHCRLCLVDHLWRSGAL